MKKMLAIFYLMALCTLCKAQINTQIFGLNIGKDTRKQCVKKLESKGYSLHIMPDDGSNDFDDIIIYAGEEPLTYAKLGWDYIAISFYDSILYNVYFVSLQNTQEECDDISQALELKYSNFNQHNTEVDSLSGATDIIYSDRTTTVVLRPDATNGITLNYANDQLENESKSTERKRIQKMSEDL